MKFRRFLAILVPRNKEFWRDRSVWAPQRRSAGTSMGPMLSVSVRIFSVIGFSST